MNDQPRGRGRFLVIGASGFIGSHVWRHIRASGYTVLGTQAHSRRAELTVFRLGVDRIRDCVPAEFWQTDETQVAVHCAAYSAMDRCRLEREASRRVNVDATVGLMEDLDQRGFRQVYLSTSYVFDGERGDYSETDDCAPISEYGRQKRDVENWMNAQLPRALILRLDKTVGADPRERHLFSEWWALVEAGRPIACIANQFFAPTLVTDVARGVLLACDRHLEGLYHVANPQGYYRDQLAREFLRTVRRSVPVDAKAQAEFGFADRRPQRTTLNSDRFRQAAQLEFTPMQQTLQRFADQLAGRGTP